MTDEQPTPEAMQPAGEPSAEAMEAAIWSALPGPVERERLARAIDAFAGRRVEQAVAQAAKIVRGEPIHEGHYRQWPAVGDGNRAADDPVVQFCEALAKAIESGRPKP